MNNIFQKYLDDFPARYLDDLIIFTECPWRESLPPSLSPEDNPRHVQQVCQILQVLWDNSLYANPKKCIFHVQIVDFLRYIVTPDGLSMDPEKTCVMAEWPKPRNVKDILSFLSFTNFY
jgi:hypothetical protein